MKKCVLCFLGFVVMFGLYTSSIGAAKVISTNEDTYVLEESIDEDLYITGGENIVINGNVDGDLFIGGGDVVINSNVGGDLFIASGFVQVNGVVEKSVYGMGGEINLDGLIKRSVYCIGGDVSISGNVREDLLIIGGNIAVDSTIGESVRITGGNIKIDGDIFQDLLVGGGKVKVFSDVEGDVLIGSGEAYIESEYIGGDVVLYGDQQNFTIFDKTKIDGDISYEESTVHIGVGNKWGGDLSPFVKDRKLGLLGGSAFKFFVAVINIVGYFILGFILIKVAPVKVKASTDRLSNFGEMIKSAGAGLMVITVGGLLILILTLSLVGLPTVGVFVTLGVLAKGVSTPLICIVIGRYLTRLFKTKLDNYVLLLVVGLFVYQLLWLIPIWSIIMRGITFVVVAGALFRVKYRSYKCAIYLQNNKLASVKSKRRKKTVKIIKNKTTSKKSK